MEEFISLIVEAILIAVVKFLGVLAVSFLCLPFAIFVAAGRPGQYLQNVFELAHEMSRKVCLR